jgi:uncharacterized protein involved in response to NO
VSHPLPLLGDGPVAGHAGHAGPWPISRKGFRPFFLLAALFACAIVPAWLLVLSGVLGGTSYVDAVSWHAHEMVFGYAVAVIAGFLLTAVGNWTQRETVVGAPLLGLAAVWALGRFAMALPAALPRALPAAIDLAFLPLLGVALARPLLAAKNRRNFVMLAIVGALACANLVVHLDALGVLPPGSARRGIAVAIDVVLVLSAIIAGRVVPMFTRNATGQPAASAAPALEVLAVVSLVAVTALDAVRPYSALGRIAAGVASALLVARAARWGTRHTASHPLLWILHAGYAWIAVGFLLRALPLFGLAIAGSLATHACTVGAIGSLTLGMMARVTRGHTGRSPLEASPGTTAAFVLITAAAIVRVGGPLVAPGYTVFTLALAGAAWTLAFGLYLVVHAPMLTAGRVDRKPG